MKSLRDKKEFVNGNEKVIALKAEINDKLEIKRQEEAKAEAKAQDEANKGKGRSRSSDSGGNK